MSTITTDDHATESAADAETLISADYEAPMGTLTLVASERGLRAILWPSDRSANTWRDRVKLGQVTTGSNRILDQAIAELDEYFAGTRTVFELPLDPSGTDFQVQAWSALAEVPYGETTTYGAQAARLGRPTAVRAVASANGRNPISIVLPCHRIIGADGSLTGFAGGLEWKRWLLDHEAAHSPGQQSLL